MQLARKGVDDAPQGAVNLALIATTPEQLAALAKANRDDHSGPSATECNGQGVGQSAIAAPATQSRRPQSANPQKGGSTLAGKAARPTTLGD
jgi:hypothetical protein